MRQCIVCGKSYVKSRSKYCSATCRRQMWKLTQREKYLESGAKYRAKKRSECSERPIVTRNCIVCDSSFEANKYHPEQKCCSPTCNTKFFQSTHRELVSAWKRDERQRHKERYTRANVRYKDQLRFSGNRLKALNRDEFTCQNCGLGEPEVSLVVHHKDFSGQTPKPNNRIENLQTLCRACHIRMHTHLLQY